MPIAQYTGATSLNYDSVSGRHWEPGQTRTVSTAEMSALIAAGGFANAEVVNSYQKTYSPIGNLVTIVHDRVWGASTGLFPLTDKTGYCTQRAPTFFDAVRVKVTCGSNTAAAFKGSIIIGERWNNGYHLQNAAGTAITPTALTWDPASPMNPDGTPGGNTTTNIANVTGTAGTYDRVDGYAYSDWIKPTTIPKRADYPLLPPPVSCRLYSTGAFPGSTGNNTRATEYQKVAPEFSQGYWYGDQTAVAAPGSTVNDSPYGLSVEFQFRSIAPAQSHGFFHDSIPLGYPATLGDMNGWPRLLVGWIRETLGVPCSYLNNGHETDPGWLFLGRALRAITDSNLTHAWIAPWSVNNTTIGGAGPTYQVNENIAIVKTLLTAAAAKGTRVNLIETPGARLQSGVWPILGPFLDNCESNGIGVVRQPDVWCKEDRTTYLPMFLFDGTHPNDLGGPAVLRYIQNNAYKFGI